MQREKKFALLRIAFGCVWLVDASFKWQPNFFASFADYLTNGASGQPALVQAWIHFWINIVNVNPNLFALVVALSETGLAIGLLLGLFPRLVSYGGMAFAFIIWSTAEGFGGPYVAGSTDIGAAIIYVFVFAALAMGNAWDAWSLHSYLHSR